MFTIFDTARQLLNILLEYARYHSVETLVNVVLVAGVVVYFLKKNFSRDRWL